MPIYVDASGEPIQAKVMSPETGPPPPGGQWSGQGVFADLASAVQNMKTPAPVGTGEAVDFTKSLPYAAGGGVVAAGAKTAGPAIMAKLLGGTSPEADAIAAKTAEKATTAIKSRLSQVLDEMDLAKLKGAVPGHGMIPAALREEASALGRQLVAGGGEQGLAAKGAPAAAGMGKDAIANLLKGIKGAGKVVVSPNPMTKIEGVTDIASALKYLLNQ